LVFGLALDVAGDVYGDWPASRLAMTVWLLARSLQAPAYAQMTLAYPSGRVRDRTERAFLVAAYAVSLAWGLVPALFSARPVPSLIYVGGSAPGWGADAIAAAFIALGLAFLALVARRLRRVPRGALRTAAPLAVAAALATADFILTRVAQLTGAGWAYAPLNYIDDTTLLVLPLAILAGIVTIRRGRVGDLVVTLAGTPDDVRGALAQALGDPGLELALWVPGRGWVHEDGTPAALDPERAVTMIGPHAAVVHDPALADQRGLIEAAGAAARLALENARLNAQVARVVAAGDAERRRLERDLHDGAQQRLLSVGMALQLSRDDPARLADAEAELRVALAELRDLARGIHPAILTDEGLPAAIAGVADRAPLPVRTAVAAERFPPAVERAAYFVALEALQNASKHAGATAVRISLVRRDGSLVLDVVDDGAGFDPRAPVRGDGIANMRARVAALGGRTIIDSERGDGTRVRAILPIEPDA
jgi:signal transduction histidine kinase